ncbi:hypothetical protein EI427_03245 [Flammeovirga pectinis]|uniref:Uncharacterized protein n=1 Tax=Flammeovirga pectinis TaxID=2494373 RepID=A0A3Q9FLF7_9BACT|nr:hypothetical protein [Flammeovirga pectinis]AZQ61270.1 hypothetical protein EI427_03245 [Flammeovirga pectinis]
MKSEWTITYQTSEIKVVNTWFNGEFLFVNDELQDRTFGLYQSALAGHLINSKGEREMIKIRLGGAFKIKCYIFIDDKFISMK